MMVFNRKADFFLDLGSEGAKPAQVAMQEVKPAAPVPTKPQADAAKTAAKPAAEAPAPSGAVLTTAEAIAAELRAAQEAKPPASLSTFAPDCLNPANAVPTRRRRGGANLAGFKAMASGMFRN
jgi:hypothetical protein